MELLDVYDENGHVTGKIVKRGSPDEVFNEGEHIAVAIVFIENSKGEFLIQKLPDNTYSSTGGHVNQGEKPDNTIIREIKEELGLDVSFDELISLGFRLVDFPVRFLYYLKKDIDIDKLKLQESEVKDVSFMTKEEIKNLIENGTMNKGHGLLYKEILKFKGENYG